jgi:hypothetical protein
MAEPQSPWPNNVDIVRSRRLSSASAGLAPKTVRIIHGIVREALSDALRQGSVTRNVAHIANRPPKVRLGSSTAMTVWCAGFLEYFG